MPKFQLFFLLSLGCLMLFSCVKECEQTKNPNLIPSVGLEGTWVESGDGVFNVSVSSYGGVGVTLCEVLYPGSFINLIRVEYLSNPDDTDSDIVLTEEVDITNMLVGQIRKELVTINNLQKGLYVIYYTIDSKNEVIEYDEQDNDFLASILVE